MVTCGEEGTARTSCSNFKQKLETENYDTGQVVKASLHFNVGVVLSSLFSLFIIGDSDLKAFLPNKCYKVINNSEQLPDNREGKSISLFFFLFFFKGT